MNGFGGEEKINSDLFLWIFLWGTQEEEEDSIDPQYVAWSKEITDLLAQFHLYRILLSVLVSE